MAQLSLLILIKDDAWMSDGFDSIGIKIVIVHEAKKIDSFFDGFSQGAPSRITKLAPFKFCA